MKKNILSLLLVLCVVTFTTAQTTEFDAMKMAQTDITGTARYMGMAGAFGALGGDVSAIKDNPAGLGVYRSWELTTTFNFLTQTSNSKWNGQSASDDMFKFGFNNFSLIMSFPTWASQSGSSSGLLQSNWGFSYNRLKNFNRNMYARGSSMDSSISDYIADFTVGLSEDDIADKYAYDKPYIPWMSLLAYDTKLIEYTGDGRNHTWESMRNGDLVTPRYYLQERGYIDEYSISWAGNFSNMLYFGAAVNFQTVNYRMRSQYIEDFGAAEYLDILNELRTTGMGVSFDAGLIYRPTNFLRLGIAYKTPMRYVLKDISSGDFMSGLVLGG